MGDIAIIIIQAGVHTYVGDYGLKQFVVLSLTSMKSKQHMAHRNIPRVFPFVTVLCEIALCKLLIYIREEKNMF